MRTFTDWHHAHQYLSESLIRIGGEPVWVRCVTEDDKLWYFPKGKDERKSIYRDDKDIDLTPVPMGYVNMPAGYHATYTSRVPRRMWKVGLCPGNANSTRSRMSVGFLCSQDFAQCIKGVYPKFDDVVRSIRTSGLTTAFNRFFAIDYDNILLYKDRAVGRIEQNKPVLDEKYFYLQEVLNGAIA